MLARSPSRNRRFRLTLTLLALAGLVRPAAAQPAVAVDIPRLGDAPAFEDFLDMDPHGVIGQRMARVATFVQLEPDEGHTGSEPTVAWLGYTSSHLHVVVLAFDRDPGAIRARLAARDQIYDDDRVFVWLDTFADQRHALAVGVNPLNVQGDFAFTDPDGFDTAVDVVFESRAALTPQGYVAWFAIPFRSLRFEDAPRQPWRVMIERTIAHRGEAVFWPGLTSRIEGRTRQFASLAGIRDVSPGRALQFTPYAAAASTTGNGRQRHDEGRGGLDVKAVLRQSLVLDGTIRPDFSQIESDEPQLLANERFEVAVTERRPFFLENASLLRNTTGADRMQLFFSRRIVAPEAGARLTGRLGAWSLGTLTAIDRIPGAPPDDRHAATAVGVLRHDLPGRSDVGVLALHRSHRGEDNQVGALEGRFTLSANWSLAALLAGSRSAEADGTSAAGTAAAIEAVHEGGRLRTRTAFHDVSPGFRSALGFVPRVDIRTIDQSARWLWRPGGRVVSHGASGRLEYVWNGSGAPLDRTAEAGYEVTLTGPTTLAVTRREQRERFGGRTLRAAVNEVRASSFRSGLLTGEVALAWGGGVNHAPAAGRPPETGSSTELTLTAAFRPTRGLRLDQSVMFSGLADRQAPSRALRAFAWRSTMSWQVTPGWSLRAMVERQETDVAAAWSSARQERRTAADLLLAFRLRPGTAFYLGYASGTAVETPAGIPRPDPAGSRQHRVFVKASYLLWR